MAQVADGADLEQLPTRIADTAQEPARGKLKIFLGYAAGVGKTHTMLEAARQRLAEGVDVVAAYVETHGRAETEALLRGLETAPRRRIVERGITLTEMDTDAVLARRPELALIDELAHSNPPGCRHRKRYLDVEELLAAGINVYTTLNIQHLESLGDVVAQITGIVVRERVPDRLMDAADAIELIDLPPPELLARLREGKVGAPEQAARASDGFFRLGNLTALRELALRRAAGRVDDQMRTYMQAQAIPGPWPAGERLLVCVSAGAASERLIRAAKRQAQDLNAEWFALYVEVPGHSRLSSAERDAVARHLHLAEELGARAVSLPGRAVAEAAIAYARQHNITKIIVGKALRPRWLDALRGSLVEDVIRHSGDIDVYVITSGPAGPTRGSYASQMARQPWTRYLLAAALVVVMSLLGELIGGTLSAVSLVMLYLAAVVIAALYLGRGPSIVTALLSVLVFDFFFVPPRFTFAVANTEYLLTFAGLLVVGLVISSLTSQARDQAESAERREIQAVQLYEFSRDLSIAGEGNAVLQTIIKHVRQTFNRQAAILLPDEHDRLASAAASAELTLDASDMAVADWAYRHDQPAGRGTDTVPAARVRCLPLKTARGAVGVVAFTPDTGSAGQLTPDQRRLMETFASQAAAAIERAQLAERASRAQLLEATEKLQSALLNSISHDLRTPLVTITGAFSSLETAAGHLDEATRASLAGAGREEAERLNRLVGNLLDITRIESGALKVTEEPADVEDALGVVLDRLGPRLDGRQVTVDLPGDFAAVPMDLPLIVQALFNVLDNALKYSPAGSPIAIAACPVAERVAIEIADRGPGIPAEDLPHIFDKFYRVQRPGGANGTGLGLSISKGIVEAHGGTITARNREDGGTVVTIALPVDRPPAAEKD